MKGLVLFPACFFRDMVPKAQFWLLFLNDALGLALACLAKSQRLKK